MLTMLKHACDVDANQLTLTSTLKVYLSGASAAEPLSCPNRKQRERMAELQERRQSLQALLSMRLAELRRICLQEAVSDVIVQRRSVPSGVSMSTGQSLIDESNSERFTQF